MKKVFSGVLAAAIVLSMCLATGFAAGPGCGRHFADADGDGVCDNAGSQCAYTDADGDGICDVCGAAHAQPGGNFVDADGDGICDNYRSGRGCGYGRGARGGCGTGFRGGRCR